MVDLDHFKRVDDTEGHDAGPETSLEGGRVADEKIRRRIAETVYYFGGKEILVTASFGIAEFYEDLDLERLIKVANEALYRAKNLGRNRDELSDMRNEGELS